MTKLHVLTAAVALAGSVAFAQTAQTTTEKTEVRQSSDGASSSKTTTKVTQTEYVNQLRTVYRTAGVEQTKVERLIELDRKIYEAWIAGDTAAVRRYRMEQRALLGQDELQKVHVYFQSHPLPATYPEFIVNTWAPEGTFNPDISISSTRTGTAAGSINVGSSTSSNPSGAAVSGSTRTGSATETGGAASSPSTSGGSVSGSSSTDTSVSGSSGTGSSVDASGSSNTSGAAGTSGSTGTSGQTGSSSAGSTGNMSGSTGGSTSGSTGATGQSGTGSSASGSGSTGSASGSGSSN